MTYSMFFFSSRRRHTRCSRDWSSDVCSSDLLHPGPAQVVAVGVDPPLLEFHLATHPRHHVSNGERDTRVIGVNCPLHDSVLPVFRLLREQHYSMQQTGRAKYSRGE